MHTAQPTGFHPWLTRPQFDPNREWHTLPPYPSTCFPDWAKPPVIFGAVHSANGWHPQP